VASARLKPHSRPSDKVTAGARYPHFAWLRLPADASSDVDCESGEVVANDLTLARVEPGPDLDTEIADGIDQRLGAADRAGRPGKHAERAVAHHLDHPTTVSVDMSPQDGLVAVKHAAPAVTALLGRLLGRTDDVSEENGGQETTPV
jgi:hypothetical protein